MKVIELREEHKSLWDNFAKKNGSLLQSWDWGKLKKVAGWEPIRLAVVKNSHWFLAASILKKKLPLSRSFFYAPEGPMINDKCQMSNVKACLELLLGKIGRMVGKERAIFLRIEPLFEIPELERIGFLKSFEDVQPEHRLWLDLKQTEEEILKKMKHKGRYNIKLAKRRGVNISESNGNNMLDTFYGLYLKSSKRDNFSPRPKVYFKHLFRMLKEKDYGTLFIAFYKKNPVAAIIVTFFGRYATYLYGGSSDLHRNVMAPYLIQWEAIKQAKKRGCSFYDLGAISEESDIGHRFFGLRQFKTRFGGEEARLPGCYDFVYDKLEYNMFKFIEKLRRKL